MLCLGHALYLVSSLLDRDEGHSGDPAQAPLQLTVTPARVEVRGALRHREESAQRQVALV